MRKLIFRIIAAIWAFRYVDDLTMLKYELLQESAHVNSHGRFPHTSLKADWWYRRYLQSLPLS